MNERSYIVNVEGAVIRDDQYLLIERAATQDHAAGRLAFPGGKVEADSGVADPLEATVRRELREEVGLEVESAVYVGSRTFEADTGHECLNVVMLCGATSGDPYPKAMDEVAAVRWMPAERIRAHDDVPVFLKRDIDRIESARQ